VVDVHLAHPGAFHHQVEGDEVFRDERDQIQRVILDGGLGFAEALEALEIGQQAEGHHLERLGMEVAEVESIRPDVVEVLVEFPDLRDGVEFVGVVVAADGVLVDVGGLDDGSGLCVEAVAGEGAGEVVAAEDVTLESRVAAFFLSGFEFFGLVAEGVDFSGFRHRKAEPGAEHDLFPGRKVNGDKGCARLAPEVRLLKAGVEVRIE
jgi:hypothetical protein